MHDEE
jgi:hypothetical protein